MNDFIELKFKLSTFNPWADVLSQILADIGFDSFKTEEPFLFAYCKESLFDESRIKSIITDFEDQLELTYSINTIPAQNWNALWEANFQPVGVSDKIFIRAPFHPGNPDFQYEILLTPKMSFGTGHHATTHMMMQEMLKIDFSEQRVLDVGCGTAILSILAEKLGSSDILAIDNDEWAVTNGIENAEINNCQKIIVENAEVQDVSENTYNVILANINRNIITKDISTYSKLLADKGQLLLSGFHHTEAPQMEELGKSLDLEKVDQLSRGEWCMLHLSK